MKGWARSYGGPLILLEEGLLNAWQGILNKNGEIEVDHPFAQLRTHYDQACVASLTVECNKLLATKLNVDCCIDSIIFYAPPFMGRFFNYNDRRFFITSDEYDNEILLNVDFNKLNWTPTELVIEFKSSRIIVFDSGAPGIDVIERDEYAACEFALGKYTITTSEIEQCRSIFYEFVKLA